MGRPKKATVEDVLPLVAEKNGNISAMARALGCSRHVIYQRCEESATLKQALEDAKESMTDNVESAFYREILNGNVTAMIFYLKTQGKKRGYVERQEVTGADGGPIKHVNQSELDRDIESLLAEMADRAQAGAEDTPERTPAS